MKVLKRKHIIYGLIFIGIFCLVSIAHAEGLTYKPLQPIPGITSASDLPTYLKALFNLGIAAAGLLAVLMIMYGGVKYMSTEAYSGKSDAKDIIIRSLLGLLLAFASWLILFTINPDLLNLDFSMEEIDTETDPLPPTPEENADDFRERLDNENLGIIPTNAQCPGINNIDPDQTLVIVRQANIGAAGNLCRNTSGAVQNVTAAVTTFGCTNPPTGYEYLLCSH